MKKLLDLNEDEEKNIDYLNDAGFYDVYKFIIKKPVIKVTSKFWLIFLGYFLLINLLYLISPIASFIVQLALYKKVGQQLGENIYQDFADVHERNSFFSLIKNKVTYLFSKNRNGDRENNINENNINNSNIKTKNINSNDLLTNEEIENFKKEILQKSKTFINNFFDENIKSILEEIKFLLFIDEFNKEDIWYNRIFSILINSFNSHKMLTEKKEIIIMFNKKSKQQNGVKKLNCLIEECIKNMISEIKLQFSKKNYNEKEGINCLEHLIQKITLGELNEDSASNIINQVLSQNIIDKEGKFNTNLFKFEGKYKQYVKIYYNTPFPSKIKKIKNINDFFLEKTFEIPIKTDLILQDIQLIYYKEYKNPEVLVLKDFTNKIRCFLQNIFIIVGKDNDNNLNHFLLHLKNKIIEIIKNYFKQEIFPNILINKYNQKSLNLNKEEEDIYNLISESSGRQAYNSIKEGKYNILLS